MSASEIVVAYENGLITANEAIEQACVESVEELYEAVAEEGEATLDF